MLLLLLLLLLKSAADTADIGLMPFALLQCANSVEYVMQRWNPSLTRIFCCFVRPQTSLVYNLVQLHNPPSELLDIQFQRFRVATGCQCMIGRLLPWNSD